MRAHRRLFVLWLLLAAGLGPAAAAPSAPAYIARELPQARLAGAGGYSWFGLKIYRAELWVGEQGYRAGTPDAAPFVLELRYERTLDGRKIAEVSADQMQKLELGTPQQRAAWLETMRALFPDVQQGTRLAGAFVPGYGARFYLDGKLLGEVADTAFAHAFFAIWLHPAGNAQVLREALLGDAGPRR